MAFPTTGVLDNFNRTASTLGANWSHIHLYGTGECGANGTQAYHNVAQYAAYTMQHWSAATFGADCEVYMTIATKITATDDTSSIVARCTNNTDISTMDGYQVSVLTQAGNDIVTIERIDNGTIVQLGASIAQEISNGDSIGLECIGSTIKAYYKASGGSWTELGSRTDATYGAAGYIGFYATSTTVTWRYDDFGGGTVVAAGGTAVPVFMQQYRQRVI